MLQLLRRAFGGRVKAPTPQEKVEEETYITPELDQEMLAKKAQVSARRAAFWKTLSGEQQRQRRFELKTRIKNNVPMRFRWVDENQGTPVDFPLFIFHLTFHDMLENACDQLFTEEFLLAGLKCNAVSRIRFQRLDKYNAFMEVQPRWVEGSVNLNSNHRRSVLGPPNKRLFFDPTAQVRISSRLVIDL